MSRTAADYMAEALAEAGVKRIYGVVGDSLNGFTDALRRLESIEWVQAGANEAGIAPEPGAVTDETRRGYLWDGDVLRPARVLVAK